MRLPNPAVNGPKTITVMGCDNDGDGSGEDLTAVGRFDSLQVIDHEHERRKMIPGNALSESDHA